MILRLAVAAGLAATMSCSLVHARRPDGPGDREGAQALGYLMSIADLRVPEESACRDGDESAHAYRYRDFLAGRLAAFAGGRNVFVGQCRETGTKKCEVRISHEAKNHRSAARIQFEVVGDRVQVDSIRCAVTF